MTYNVSSGTLNESNIPALLLKFNVKDRQIVGRRKVNLLEIPSDKILDFHQLLLTVVSHSPITDQRQQTRVDSELNQKTARN